MLRKLLSKLLKSKSSYSKRHYGPHAGRRYSSSDHGYRPKDGAPPQHNQYGQGYYRKKGYSSSDS